MTPGINAAKKAKIDHTIHKYTMIPQASPMVLKQL